MFSWLKMTFQSEFFYKIPTFVNEIIMTTLTMESVNHNSNKDPGKEKECPLCNTRFLCSHSPECWCMDYSLTAETLAFLRQRYDDCLCPACLSHYGLPKNDADEAHTQN